MGVKTKVLQASNMTLVAHTWCDPNRATQCRAHNVAADSRSLRDVAGMSRYTPPKDCVAPVFPPPVAILFGVFWREKNRHKIGGGRCCTGQWFWKIRQVSNKFEWGRDALKKNVKKGLSRNPREILPNKLRGDFFRGFFLWIFGAFFSWRKTQNSLDRGQSRKSDLVNFWGPDWREISELCVSLFFLGKSTKCSPNPGLVNQFRPLRGVD